MEHVLMKRFDDELWIKYDYFVEKFEQLSAVTAERDYWERNASEMNSHWKKEIAAVTAERDDLVVDAKRYRWFRSLLSIEGLHLDWTHISTAVELDAAIDALAKLGAEKEET